MDGPQIAARLAEDRALFSAVGEGTPSSIVHGQFLSGAQPLDVFEQAVESQRAAMEERIGGGASLCIAFEQRLDEQLPRARLGQDHGDRTNRSSTKFMVGANDEPVLSRVNAWFTYASNPCPPAVIVIEA